MRPITIRDREFRVVSKSFDLGPVAARCRPGEVERVDLWPHEATGTAQVGVSWRDGSSCIFDWQNVEQARRWVAALPPEVAGLLKEHHA